MRVLAVLLCLFAVALRAANDDDVRDLGEGLGYVRIKELDTAPVPTASRPLVIDLRHATLTTPAAAGKLQALLAADGPPRFVLVSEATPPALLALLDARAPNVLTLGATSPALTPDIAVAATTEEDRLAYDAIDQGTPLAAIVRQSIEKERYDEAAMMRDHANGVPLPDAPPTPEIPAPIPPSAAEPPAATTPAEGAAKAAAAPPVDAVLVRAVQVYQGLRALRKT